jgi:hypothetical protein
MRRNLNLGNILVALGLVGLGLSFFAPSWSAERVARVESRAERTSELLLDALRAGGAALLADPTGLLADLRERCLAAGLPGSDLPELEQLGAGQQPVFGNRHYLFRAVPRASPAEDPEAAPGPLEVYGWPRTLLPPGRTTFYFPIDGPPAFTRNLSAGFEGLRRMPAPGAGLPAGSELPQQAGAEPRRPYRSRSDERWLPLPAR